MGRYVVHDRIFTHVHSITLWYTMYFDHLQDYNVRHWLKSAQSAK